MLHFIYELIDPRTETVAYVGITTNPNSRLQQHVNCMDENNEKIEWIQQLQKEALEPRMKILEIVETREEAIEKEKQWIQHYLAKGVSLSNIKNASQSTENGSARRYTPEQIEAFISREYITTPEATRRSGLTRIYLAQLLRKGILEGFRLGREWLIYTDSLEKFLSASPRPKPKK